MKYELGDKVRIRNHWKKNSYEFMQELAENIYDEETEEMVTVERVYKKTCNEVGYICGLRNVIKSVKFGWTGGDWESEGVFGWESGTEQQEQVYLVATRMNCLRRVSFEDIEFIGGAK